MQSQVIPLQSPFTPSPRILIALKDVYGTQTIYPVCEAAKTFAAIAGTKTITRAVLDKIVALGYLVEIEPQVRHA